jgi:hypothetical protein
MSKTFKDTQNSSNYIFTMRFYTKSLKNLFTSNFVNEISYMANSGQSKLLQKIGYIGTFHCTKVNYLYSVFQICIWLWNECINIQKKIIIRFAILLLCVEFLEKLNNYITLIDEVDNVLYLVIIQK